jgi:hypothetical protein
MDTGVTPTYTGFTLTYITKYDSLVNHISIKVVDYGNIDKPLVPLTEIYNPIRVSPDSMSFTLHIQIPDSLVHKFSKMELTWPREPGEMGFILPVSSIMIRMAVQELGPKGQWVHNGYIQYFLVYPSSTTAVSSNHNRTITLKPAKYPLTDILGRASISVPNFQVVW